MIHQVYFPTHSDSISLMKNQPSGAMLPHRSNTQPRRYLTDANDISLCCNDMSLSLNEISLGGSDISPSSNDISLRETIIREELNDISAISRSCQNNSPAIYRRYLAIIAINNDNRLHYFCTVLYQDPPFFLLNYCFFFNLNISSSSDNNVNSFQSNFLFYFRYLMHKDLKHG